MPAWQPRSANKLVSPASAGNDFPVNSKFLIRAVGFSAISLTAILGSVGCGTTRAPNTIRSDAIAFLRDGVTRRAEVLDNLGQPLVVLDKEHAIAYAWSTKRQSSYDEVPPWLVGVDNSQRRMLCIALDEKDVVQRHAVVKGPDGGSLAADLGNWVNGTPKPK